MHHGILLSGFEVMHGNFGDSRLLNLCAEHAYQYLSSPFKRSFWSPNWQFFPVENTFAYSDVFIGATAPYLLPRVMGLDPFLAFQIWWMATTGLNFLAFFWLAWSIGFRGLASSLGAFCFAAGLPVISYLGHPQLLANYWTALFFAFFWWAHNARTKNHALFYSCLAGVCLSLQFWSSVYLGWFAVLGCSIIGLFWLTVRRDSLVAFVRGNMSSYLLFGVVSGVLIFPLFYKYSQVLRASGGRSASEILLHMPTLESYFFTSRSVLAYQWFHDSLKSNMSAPHESYMFVGVVPLIALAYGVLRSWTFFKTGHYRKTRDVFTVVEVSCTVLVCLVLLLVMKTHGGFNIWIHLFKLYPGASAIRAMGRVSIFLMLPLSILICILLDRNVASRQSSSKKPTRLSYFHLVLAMVAVLETVNVADENYSKSASENSIRAVIAATPRECNVFYSRRSAFSDTATHVEAMWASILSNKPTINGYSGFNPEGYSSLQLDRPSLIGVDRVKDWLRIKQANVEFRDSCFIVN